MVVCHDKVHNDIKSYVKIYQENKEDERLELLSKEIDSDTKLIFKKLEEIQDKGE
jgi:hypothetical protein